jgi:hypothetical protein
MYLFKLYIHFFGNNFQAKDKRKRMINKNKNLQQQNKC